MYDIYPLSPLKSWRKALSAHGFLAESGYLNPMQQLLHNIGSGGGSAHPAVATESSVLTGDTAWLDLPDAVIPLPEEPAARSRVIEAFRAGMPWLCVRSDLQMLRVYAAPHFPPTPETGAVQTVDPAAAAPLTAAEWNPESPAFSVHDYPPPPVLWETGVSTAAKGLGEEPGSYRTPRGWHVIAERFGDDQPEGAEFKSRKPTGRVWKAELAGSESAQTTWSDLILTRILWLDGLEAANRSSYDRYIYFHGTNQEDRIGSPASHGCVRLRNKDMLRLYDIAPVGTPVWIG